MKWEKGQKKKRRRKRKEHGAKLCLTHQGLSYNQNAKCLWSDVVVGVCIAGNKEQARGEVAGGCRITHIHTLTPWRCPVRPQPCTVGCWVITLEQLWGQCLAQGHFLRCCWGRDESNMLGLSRSGTKYKLFYLGLLFILRRQKGSHYGK